MTEPAARRTKLPLIDLALVLSTAFCVGISIGLFPPLIALNVEALGFNTGWNGWLNAMAPLAGIAAAPFSPRIIARLRPLGAYFAAVSISVIAACCFPFLPNLLVWFLLRFAMGLGMALQWIVGEAWLNRLAIGPRRGLILSIYVIIICAGLTTGPLIMKATGAEGYPPFLAGALVLGISSLPLLFARHGQDEASSPEKPVPLLKAFLRRPATMLAAVGDGFVFVNLMVFLSIYLMRAGLPEATALDLLTLFFAGSIIFMIAVGYLLDRFAVERVLAASCLLLAALLTILPFVIGMPTLPSLLVLGIGAASGAFYTAGLAGINDVFGPEEMASGTSVFSTLWYVGGLTGPIAGGYAMLAWDPHGLIATAVAASLILGAINLTVVKRASARPTDAAALTP
jgi:MFS family permease